MKLTRDTLPDIAAALSFSVSAVLLDRAKLASDARNAGITDYAQIIGVAFRRSESTVSHWARTGDWIIKIMRLGLFRDWNGGESLPYSFFESCARYSDRIETAVLCELLMTYNETAGATLESFRADLAVMAGADSGAEFSKWLEKESAKLRRKANDFGLPAFMRDGLLLAADTLDDTKNKVVMA